MNAFQTPYMEEMMITLEQLWRVSGNKKGLKVRYMDWNHKWKYFEIHGLDKSGKKLEGVLCSGEKVSYDKNSRHWLIYSAGDENMARAV